jgi:hypothetical protein
MSQERIGQRNDAAGRYVEPSGGVVGVIAFAGIMMIMIGVFHVFSGLAAIVEDSFYVTTPNYLLEFDVTTWGWIHLIAGIVVAAAGFGVFAGRTWARVVGITLAFLSAIVSFAFIPYYPVWSVLIIVLDVFVIWALAVHGREVAID